MTTPDTSLDLGPPAPEDATGRSRLAGLGERARRDPSAALLIAQVAVAAVAFAANILAARALAPGGRGELALFLQIGYLASLGLLLGTDRSVVAVYSGTTSRVASDAFLRLLVRPCLVGVAVATVLATILDRSAVGEAGAVTVGWWAWMAVTAGFAVTNAVVRASRSIAIAAGRHRDYLSCTLTCQGLLLLAQLGLLATDVQNVVVWLLAYLVTAAVPTAAVLIYWRHDGRPPTHSVPDAPALRRQARREGLALLPSAIANTGMLRLDRLVLAGLVGTVALGQYASVATMTEALAWPVLAVADSRLGRWRAAHDQARLDVTALIRRCLGYVVVVGPMVGVALWLLVVPLLGSAYRPARALVAPLVAAALVFAVGQVLVGVLIAQRRNRFASLAELTGFAVSVVAYLVLIPGNGAVGAAYASLIGYSAGCAAAAAAVGTGSGHD